MKACSACIRRRFCRRQMQSNTSWLGSSIRNSRDTNVSCYPLQHSTSANARLARSLSRRSLTHPSFRFVMPPCSLLPPSSAPRIQQLLGTLDSHLSQASTLLPEMCATLFNIVSADTITCTRSCSLSDLCVRACALFCVALALTTCRAFFFSALLRSSFLRSCSACSTTWTAAGF